MEGGPFGSVEARIFPLSSSVGGKPVMKCPDMRYNTSRLLFRSISSEHKRRKNLQWKN